MLKEKLVSAANVDEIWQQITEEVDSNGPGYSFIINYANRKIFIEIDIDPGGGFEGGYQFTTLKSQLLHSGNFRFALHHQGLLDELGKFFGIEDVETGFTEFDKKVVVKTNDVEKIKLVFAEASCRKTVEDLNNFKFHITGHHIGEANDTALFLELNLEEAITDMILLQQLFKTFYSVLMKIEEG